MDLRIKELVDVTKTKRLIKKKRMKNLKNCSN